MSTQEAQTCTVRFTREAAYLTFGYSAPFIAALKEIIPRGHRRWDPENGWWQVSLSFASEAVALARKYFTVVECFGRKPKGLRLAQVVSPTDLAMNEAEDAWRAKAEFLEHALTKLNEESKQRKAEVASLRRELAQAQSTVAPEYRALHILPTAPVEVVKAAYRALALLYHPDRSQLVDATEQMKVINDAYEHLSRKQR